MLEVPTPPLIDSFCNVSGDSDYTPWWKAQKHGKFVLGISRSEVASTIFYQRLQRVQFLESVSGRAGTKTAKKTASSSDPLDESELNKLIESISTNRPMKTRSMPANSGHPSAAAPRLQ
jgi:hypothetical protein